jgi:hypothetical protein
MVLEGTRRMSQDQDKRIRVLELALDAAVKANSKLVEQITKQRLEIVRLMQNG